MLNRIKFSFIAVLALTLFVPLQSHAQDISLKIAVVDMNRVLNVAKAPISIAQQVQQRSEVYRQELAVEKDALTRANQDLAQKQNLLTQESFQQERQKFEQELLAVQKKVQEKNKTLQAAQAQAQEKVKQALREIVIQISQERGIELILENSQTIVVADRLNITEDVIKALNEKLPNVKVF